MNTGYNITLGDSYIMAVKDSVVQAKKMKHFLDDYNLNSKIFYTAVEAYETAIKDPPVLIISDIVMPGMDGYEFCKKLKGNPDLREVPIILLTSLRDPLDIIRGLQAGADNFITKPYEEKYLLSRINYLLANREIRRAGGGEMVLEIVFRGNKYAINSDKKQILDLLLSVYEAAVQRNDELILAQEQLQTMNENLVSANRELEAFSYTVSHDLRSSLHTIFGYTQLMLEDYIDQIEPEAIGYLNTILTASKNMSQLIDGLLKFSRSGRAKVEKELINLSEIAHQVIQLNFQRDPSRVVHIKIEQGITGYADKNLLGVVLDNLLGNAWKYSGKKEEAEIGFGMTELDGEKVYFVKDNGAGFYMNKADKMFNPFERFHSSEEFSGTGVGLATVRRILEKHDGRIWAESKIGEGSTFYFTLPS
ncbi:MAG: hybrid sensor histidine kinase/response regulator [Bacteroidetes bacterium]|nr:MAG: hybrid sensor histidine kinase/response regulator [Bacteroidota bacterium]